MNKIIWTRTRPGLKPRLGWIQDSDWWGGVTTVGGLGAMEYPLGEGGPGALPRKVVKIRYVKKNCELIFALNFKISSS